MLHAPRACPPPRSREPSAARHAFRRRSEEHTSELQSPCNLVCRLLLEKKILERCHSVLTCLRVSPPAIASRIRGRPSDTLLPYTTLFRSIRRQQPPEL